MVRDLRDNLSYGKAIALFSILTLTCGLAVAIGISIAIPFAAAFCACLFVFENPKRRFLSYVIPALSVLVNILLAGIYTVLNIQFIFIAIALSLLYCNKKTKAEAAFYLSAITTVFIIIFLFVYPIGRIGSFGIQNVFEFYKNGIDSVKERFIEYFSSFSVTLADGSVEHLMSYETAKELFDSFVMSLPMLICGLSFLFSGIAIKTFSAITLRTCKHGLLRTFVLFMPSQTVSWFYVAVAVFNLFIRGENLFEIAIINICGILMLVFAYVGFNYLQLTAKASGKSGLFYTLAVVALLIATSAIFQLLSYLGAYFIINLHRKNKIKDAD